MAIISLRNVKGSPLTNAEVDANFTNLNVELSTKQGILVSGSNIKTINGATVLGSGDLIITSLPTQTGNSGKYLSTNGTIASWTTLGTIASQSSDAVDITGGSVVASIIKAFGSGSSTSQLQIGTSNTAYWDLSRDNATTGDLIITSKVGATLTERMRIDSTGKVGIGTAAIGSPLSVQGNMELRGAETGTATAVVGYLKGSDGTQAGYWGYSSTTTPFEFSNSRSTGFSFIDGVTERCRITSGGAFVLGDTTADYSELIKVKSAALGGTAGDSVTNVQLVTPDSSTNRVLFKTIRTATGTSDTTNRHIIQRRIGTTDQGYIGLDNAGVSFGIGITEQLRIGTSGAVGIGGANYGTSGQLLMSNGSGAAPTWQTISSGASVVITATNGDFYPMLTSTTTGALVTANIVTDNLKFNPSTGVLTSKVLNFVSEFSNGSVGTTTKTIAWVNGQKQNITITGAPTTIVFDWTGCSVGNYQLRVITGGTSAYTISWSTNTPGSTQWLNATTAPTLRTGLTGAMTIFNFYYPGTGNPIGTGNKVGAF